MRTAQPAEVVRELTRRPDRRAATPEVAPIRARDRPSGGFIWLLRRRSLATAWAAFFPSGKSAGVQGRAGPAQLDALDEHPDPADEVEQAEHLREGDRADAGAGAQHHARFTALGIRAA